MNKPQRKQSTKKVHPRIAELIEELHSLLLNEYNADYAYIIMAQGKVVASSTMTNGYIAPTRVDRTA